MGRYKYMTYLLGSCGHTTFGKSLLTLCPWLKYDGQKPSFLVICRISRVQASWVVTVRELVHHQNPSCLYVFVEFSWRTAENNDMILYWITQPSGKLNLLWDLFRMVIGKSDLSAATRNACHTGVFLLTVLFWLFVDLKVLREGWTSNMSVISELPKVSIWLSCPSIPGRWWRHRCGTERGKVTMGCGQAKGGSCWDLHAEPGCQGVCGVCKPHESIGFRMTTSNILRCARGKCMEMLHSSQKRIRTFCLSAAQEHRSGLRVRDLVAAHAVAKGWTANSALFVFFRPFQTTTSGAGRFSLLRFWKLVVLETRGSWICPKSHCQQNHQHYFKMLKAFQWWC